MTSSRTPLPPMIPEQIEVVEKFRFHDPFAEGTDGFYLNNYYFPEEIITLILSYIEPKEILKATLVCRSWCNIIKSTRLWTEIYIRHFKKKPKHLPWYIYYSLFTSDIFDKNLIKNGNGQNNFDYWFIAKNYGDEFKIEDPPQGCCPLPEGVPEFNGATSCFTTSYYECNKFQQIYLTDRRLLQYIFLKYRPHIYVSEWVAGRFDCGCIYTLIIKLFDVAAQINFEGYDSNDEENEKCKSPFYKTHKKIQLGQWEGMAWQKIEMIITNYPSRVINEIRFQHEGRDTQFWKGHYGSKMAGGVLKILFDSIDPESIDE